ncbi:hypothetical protein Back11_04750 [Paenibacillus baekrokdamisoli]|uniref:Uncharacterized protein n=1 Tax=Paenibacillus baekrokdamisoli TaxID=1712516 RepID=A0A3G9IJP8_9BACL|nr:hypothetical protein [Paenibacillus baekrokdamisoli]MBB3067685.1 frataxin-like iron-binding protein CyaY [Paenibacillus baekrokdamisoli]BBH19130.1 hypothetical protein Back11_04750 [Paenibacillus baekrokdamisoli]
MFKWLKKNRKITIQEQQNKLREIGVNLKEHIRIDKYLNFEISDYEKRPYLFLMMAMGSETEDEDSLFISDDVWYFDRECIEDKGDYIRIIERISEIVKFEITIEDIDDYVNIENEQIWISFKVNGNTYKYELVVNYDWMDIRIFEIFSELLERYGSGKRFYFSDIDQSLLVVAIQKEYYKDLNQLLNIFIPAYLGEGRTNI